MNSLITLAYFVMSKSFSLIVHTNYQMTVILSREISSGLSPMSCVQTLQTCLAATCLLVWSPESGQDLTSRVRELMRILIFSQLILWRFSIFFPLFAPIEGFMLWNKGAYYCYKSIIVTTILMRWLFSLYSEYLF